jgi:uncharacterized membrane protein YqiK
MNEQLMIISAAVGAMFIIMIGMLVMFKSFFVRVKPNEALIVTTPNGKRVFPTGGMVFPIMQSAEPIDLSIKTLRIERRAANALLTKDDERVEVDIVVTMRVNQTNEDMLKVAERIGCAKTYEQKTIEDLFTASFTSAVLEVVRYFTANDLDRNRSEAEDKILQVIGSDLQGYVIEKLALERVAKANMESAGPFR